MRATLNGKKLQEKNKTYFFLGGLPRSGNTVLSALLNQHPQIYSGPISPVCNILWNTKQEQYREPTITHNSSQPLDNVLKNIMVSYYKGISQPYIVDREKNWGTLPNLTMIRDYITPQPKIVATVRSITDILLSFLNVLEEDSYIDREMRQCDFLPRLHRDKNDARCDYLMAPNNSIEKAILGISLSVHPEYKQYFHLVEYDDLINDKQNTMNKIYDFLEIERHQHDFNRIEPSQVVNDEILGYPKDLHKVQPKLARVKHDNDIKLSEYVLGRYSNMEFWRQT